MTLWSSWVRTPPSTRESVGGKRRAGAAMRQPRLKSLGGLDGAGSGRRGPGHVHAVFGGDAEQRIQLALLHLDRVHILGVHGAAKGRLSVGDALPQTDGE